MRPIKAPKNLNRRKSDVIAKGITGAFSILFWVLFIGVIAFIIYGAIPGFKAYKFSSIFGTTTYNLEEGKAGVWLPLCVTMTVAGLALLIAAPIGIKTATFIKFRLPKKSQRYVRMVVELLADFPSVVFGLFAMTALGPVIQFIFKTPTSYNLVVCGCMLAFMIIPTVVAMMISAYDSVDDAFLFNPMVLGNTKTGAIYKVYKKNIKNKVVIALITAISRAIGETMGVSMILQSQNYNSVFSSGFGGYWSSYLKTLGGIISSNMMGEGSSVALKGLLYVYGLFLLTFIVVVNGVVRVVFMKSNRRSNKFTSAIKTGVLFIPRQFKKLWNKILNKDKNVELTPKNVSSQLPIYFSNRAPAQATQGKWYNGWKMFWETFCFSLLMAYIAWMFLTLFINGIGGVTASSSTVFQFGKDTTGQAFVNTLLVILVSVGIGFVISLAVAIYLSEFAKEGKVKSAFLFFIDSLGATPTIIYGMFGMIFFLQILSLSSAGPSGKSIMAASLTLIFVILPAFTRQIYQALQNIPLEVRQASYTLGVGKWHTVRKLVLPTALQNILASVILSVGRVLAETAPVYLTAGLGGGSRISYMSAGQTLTTRIYTQINSNNVEVARNIMYECAFITIILIIVILVMVDIVIPKTFEHKKKKGASPILINQNEPTLKQKAQAKARNLTNRFQAFYNLNIR